MLYMEDLCTFLHILYISKTLKIKQTKNRLLVMFRTYFVGVLSALVLW